MKFHIMRKHGLGAVVLSLALVLSSLSGFGFRVSAEEAGQEKVSDASPSGGDASASGGNASASGGNAGEEPTPVPTSEPTPVPTSEPTPVPTLAPVDKRPIPAPTVTWRDNYLPHVNVLPDTYHFKIEISKDGEIIYSASIYAATTMSGADCTWLQRNLNESGTYKFRAQAIAIFDNQSDSEWSEWSEEKTYVRPDKQVGTPEVYWDTENAGVVHYATIDNVREYAIELYRNGSRKVTGYHVSPSQTNVPVEQTFSRDFSSSIAKYGAGQYQVRVRAISPDLDEYANGEWSLSEVYDTNKDAAELKDILSDAMEKQTPEEAVETLKASADISAMQIAMQTDDSFREQVKELEQKYAEEKGITTSTEVSPEAKEYVDPDKVEIVGAAFNALENKNVKLDIGLTPEEKKVPQYANNPHIVQLDIKLTSGSTEVHELEMPISITMPVPKGINGQLVILHYHQDGTVERTSFHVNGDGTITFTVKAFSTFVFTNETSDENSGNESGGNENGGSNEEGNASEEEDGDEEDDNTSTTPAQPMPVVSPQTGAESPMMPYVILTALCAVLAVVFSIYRGKRTHKKENL